MAVCWACTRPACSTPPAVTPVSGTRNRARMRPWAVDLMRFDADGQLWIITCGGLQCRDEDGRAETWRMGEGRSAGKARSRRSTARMVNPGWPATSACCAMTSPAVFRRRGRSGTPDGAGFTHEATWARLGYIGRYLWRDGRCSVAGSARNWACRRPRSATGLDQAAICGSPRSGAVALFARYRELAHFGVLDGLPPNSSGHRR